MYEAIKQKNAVLFLVAFLILISSLVGRESGMRKEALKLERRCAHEISLKEEICVAEYAANFVANDGDVGRAYDLIERIFADRSGFGSHCTFAMANTGKYLAREGYDFRGLHLGVESVSCNYAFMQGYVREMVLLDRQAARAQEFCVYVRDELQQDTSGAYSECYRGIGHALPFINESLAGNPGAMVDFAIRECETLTETPEERLLCISGSFQYIDVAQWRGMYGLSIHESDPLYICEAQTTDYRDICFANVKRVLLANITPDILRDFSKTVDEIQSRYPTVPPRSLQVVAHTLAYDEVTRTAPALDIERLVSSCEALHPTLQVWCVWGGSHGIAKNGPAHNEYRQLQMYCDAVELRFAQDRVSQCMSTATIDYLHGKYRLSVF